MVEEQVQIEQKVIQYTPHEKLLDGLIVRLAGGRGLVEINTRVRPDRAVQRAFGRRGCADQSTVSDTLNSCQERQVGQLRTALKQILQQHSPTYRHAYDQRWQVLDVALTGLPAGRKGEQSEKGDWAHQPGRWGR